MNITKNQNSAAQGAFVLGTNCTAIYSKALLIGHGLVSYYDGQVKIGTSEKWIDIACTEAQSDEIRELLIQALNPINPLIHLPERAVKAVFYDKDGAAIGGILKGQPTTSLQE